MNTLYIRAAGLSLSLLALLPISATVPNGNNVLSTINGAPVVTTNALQEKMKDVVERTRPEVRKEIFGSVNKLNLASALLSFMTTAKLAQAYTQENKLNPTTLSSSIVNGLAIAIDKHMHLSLSPDEKESMHNCVLAATNLLDGLRENKAIAQAIDNVPAGVVEKVYQEMLQQADRYGIKEVPTYKEVQPYLKVALGSMSSPQIFQQLRLQGLILLMRINEKYNVKYNTQVFESFLNEHCEGTVL